VPCLQHNINICVFGASLSLTQCKILSFLHKYLLVFLQTTIFTDDWHMLSILIGLDAIRLFLLGFFLLVTHSEIKNLLPIYRSQSIKLPPQVRFVWDKLFLHNIDDTCYTIYWQLSLLISQVYPKPMVIFSNKWFTWSDSMCNSMGFIQTATLINDNIYNFIFLWTKLHYS